LIISTIDGGGYGRAMFPSINNSCKLGKSGNAFSGIWTYALTNLSDGRQKENITEIPDALGVIMKLKGVKYDIKEEYSYIPKELKDLKVIERLEDERKNKLGFIAQDVNSVLPEVVQHDDSTDVYGINYTEIIPVLVEAIKEQHGIIEELKNQVAANSLKSAVVSTGNATIVESHASLEQNVPNPFNSETRIGCTIPESSNSSVLYIYNMNGTQLQQYNVNGKGKQTVTISGSSLEPGMYLYALVVDGQEVDTKRMILTK
jgi:hypothetical protein